MSFQSSDFGVVAYGPWPHEGNWISCFGLPFRVSAKTRGDWLFTRPVIVLQEDDAKLRN